LHCSKKSKKKAPGTFFIQYMRYIVGIDEVGRGPLAGPVVVSAAAIPVGWRPPRRLGPLRDSKRLSHRQREKWSEYFSQQTQIYSVTARVYPNTIDRINISNAANLAALRAYKRLLVRCSLSRLRLGYGGQAGVRCSTYLDGGLHSF